MKKDQNQAQVQQPATDVAEEKKSTPEDQLQETLSKLQMDVQQAQEAEKRAMADYHNLVRRTQEEKIRMVKFAAKSMAESILQPLEHLFLAKEQLKDKGLDMVYQQFQQALQNEGLEEIACLGKEFDPHTMEVVDKKPVEDKKQSGKVIQIMQRGYRLNGEVIRHAKVVIGE
jgi:molecular chaperone GrpE